jgi:hypothetical protein
MNYLIKLVFILIVSSNIGFSQDGIRLKVVRFDDGNDNNNIRVSMVVDGDFASGSTFFTTGNWGIGFEFPLIMGMCPQVVTQISPSGVNWAEGIWGVINPVNESTHCRCGFSMPSDPFLLNTDPQFPLPGTEFILFTADFNPSLLDVSALTMLETPNTGLESIPPGTDLFDGYALIALPITLSEFKAAWNNSGWVDIKWTTVSEIGSDKFLVERSKDGRKWETIGTEPARGAQDIKMDYFLRDLTPYTGINYYRLKMFDLDGSYKYSPIAAVIVENESLHAKLYPNPASDFAMIDVGAGLALEEISLYNLQGKLIRHQTFTDASQYRVELADIAQGEYFMEIVLSDKQIFTKKLILTGNRN